MATHASILTWRIPWTEAWRAIIHGVTKSQTRLGSQHNWERKFIQLVALVT